MTLSMSWAYTPNRSVVLALRGEVDFASAPDLRAVISAAATRDPRPPMIVLDLSRVTYIDHSGVGTLVVANRICHQVGINLAVSNPSPLVRRLLGLPPGGNLRPDGSDPATQLVPETSDTGDETRKWINVSARAG